MTCIQTWSGRTFDLTDPDPDTVDVDDIAHALSLMCRFTGHVREHYSVAQHCVIVSGLVPPEHALAGLLHDAPEAYIGDVSRPLKALLPEYRVIEQGVWAAVAARFYIYPRLPQSVKDADTLALYWERRDLLGPPAQPWPEEHLMVNVPHQALIPWPAARAEQEWLATYWRLTAERGAP